MARQLATVRRILELLPIEGADLIELAVVDGWQVVVKKGDYAAGDLAVYLEIDSFLPVRPEYEFLRSSSFKRMPGPGPDGLIEGFRLKTIKLRGQVSQGLLLPLGQTLLADDGPSGGLLTYVHPILGTQMTNEVIEGADVTWRLGVLKYEAAVGRALAGTSRGTFPGFIPKTDEERIQNLGKLFHHRPEGPLYVTEKLDGSSMTCYLKNELFGVCSRNMDLAETEGNTFWKVARELEIEKGLRAYCAQNKVEIAIQGELIGSGIQGNKYGLAGHTFCMFSAVDVMTRRYLGLDVLEKIARALSINMAPVLDHDFCMPDDVATMLAYAEGKSKLNAMTEREGVVVRSYDNSLSFKAISNRFLLKEK